MSDTEYPHSNILVGDDQREHAQVMPEARGKLERRPYDVVVTDLVMDGKRDGLEVLRLAKGRNPMPPVILVTAHADIPTCKQALSEGAYDYIEKPLDLEYFRAQVNRAAERAALQKQNQALREQVVDLSGGFEGMIGQSQAM